LGGVRHVPPVAARDRPDFTAAGAGCRFRTL